jgi:uncharacterized repeat protein (TIGR02543 family)
MSLFSCNNSKLPTESTHSDSSSSATVIPSSDIYSKVNPSTVFVLIKWNDNNTYASGTGFFIDDSGDFVTNYHVIKNGIAGFIQKSDGTTGEIDEVLGASADLDIAILHAKVTSACSGLGNSDNVRVGDTVYAIGYPQAFVLGTSSSTFTSGMVSMNRSIEGRNFIQSTVDITNGNSGGPLINDKGEIIGITTAGINYSSIDYMNLSIPANRISSVSRDLNCSLEDFLKRGETENVAFYLNGRVYTTQSVQYGGKATKPADPAIDHYDFGGWYTDSTYSTSFDFGKAIKSSTSVYGKTTQNEFQVTVTSGGSYSNYSGHYTGAGWYKAGSNVTVTASDDEDYTFVSFQRDGKDVSTEKTYAFTMPSTAVSITGIYKPVTYTVALDVNGGDALKTSTYQVIYKNGITLPAPTRTGYSFSGWYDGSTQVSGSTFWLNVRQSVTLTAHWTANKYTLTLDGNGGKIGTSTSASVAVTYGEAYSVPTATRYGYVFGGWFNGSEKITGGTWSTAGNITAKALWTAGQFTATLDVNGGDALSTTAVSVTYGKAITLPTPTRTGYSFSGWYVNGYSKIVSGQTWLFEDATVKAIWSGNQYTITYDVNGGEALSSNTQTVIYGSPFKLATPVRTGYTFDGWFNGSEEFSSGTWELLSGVSLVAHWTVNTYTITYDVNGGEALASATQTIAYDADYTLATPIRTGYTFGGWFDGSTQIESGTWKRASDITIVAKWTANSYSATLSQISSANQYYVRLHEDPSNPSTVSRSLAIKPGETLAYPSLPNVSGYYFGGWCTDSTFANYFDFSKTVTDSVDLYANLYLAGGNYGQTHRIDPSVGTDTTRIQTWSSYSDTATIYYRCYQSGTYSTLSAWSGWIVGVPYSRFSITETYNGTSTVIKNDSQVSSKNCSLDIPMKAGADYKFVYDYNWETHENDVTFQVTITPPSMPGISLSASPVLSLPVTFDSTFDFGAPLTIPDGKAFIGWFTEETGGTQLTDAAGKSLANWTIPSSATVYPHFE